MDLDQTFFFAALTAYIVGSLALIMYFFTRDRYSLGIGVTAAGIGVTAQFAELVSRGITTQIWPLTNLYGSLSLFCAMSVLLFLIFGARYSLWFIGGFVQLVAAGFLAYAATWNEGAMPAVPALQSYWIKIHVPLVVSSYAAFMVAAVTAAIYLTKASFEARFARFEHDPKRASTPVHVGNDIFPGANVAFAGAVAGTGGPMQSGGLGSASGPAVNAGVAVSRDTPAISRAAAAGDATALWLMTLPSLPKLDVMIYRIIAVGLPLLTVGIITGAWWAKEAWGAYWQWDPKETAALLSWIVYASYMHLHTRREWRGTRTAWVSLIGFASIIFCYLGVNIWISGMHSYKL